MSDFALRFGLALVVVVAAGAAVIISRRNYAKSAVFERSIEAFRLEFQRSIDAAQVTTIKSIAKTIRDNIFSVIKPIDSTVRDLDVRLARLERQQADATAAHMAGTQMLDVRLARLEEHADGSSIQNLDVRLAKLEERTDAAAIQNLNVRLAKLEEHADGAAIQDLNVRLAKLEEHADGAAIQDLNVRLAKLIEHTDATATQIAGTQKQSLDENERIAARVVGLEQNLMAQGDQLSLIKQTIDEATAREQDIKSSVEATNNSIEAINSRILNAQTRVDELFPRLVLGEKAREDLATLISLLVKRLRRLNANSTEIVLRLSDLESRLRSKAKQIEEGHSSIVERTSTSNIETLVEDATAKAADEAIPVKAKTDGENAGTFELPPRGEESPSEASIERDGFSANSRADQHAT